MLCRAQVITAETSFHAKGIGRNGFMRSLVIAVLVLGIPSLSLAQADKSSWTNLSALQPGQKIQVVERNSKKDSGTFSMVTGTAITLHEKSGEQTIQRQDVRIVRLMKQGDDCGLPTTPVMRIPIARGAPQLVLRSNTYGRPRCACPSISTWGSFWTPSMERNEIEAKFEGEKQ
jgi:hypothetical protein